jgi:hypothetical protein
MERHLRVALTDDLDKSWSASLEGAVKKAELTRTILTIPAAAWGGLR